MLLAIEVTGGRVEKLSGLDLPDPHGGYDVATDGDTESRTGTVSHEFCGVTVTEVVSDGDNQRILVEIDEDDEDDEDDAEDED